VVQTQNIPDNAGHPPIHVAAIRDHAPVAKCLVQECGVNVNQTAHSGFTALHLAANEGHYDVAKCLVHDCGANVHQLAAESSLTLHIAANGENSQIVKMLARMPNTDLAARAQDDGINSYTPVTLMEKTDKAVALWLHKMCSNPLCTYRRRKKCNFQGQGMCNYDGTLKSVHDFNN
jgi:ankyrin repeat protein